MSNFPPSLLDPHQIVKHVYDEDSQSIRVKTNLAVNLDNQEILITDDVDSIAIGNGSGQKLAINPDGSINVQGNITVGEGFSNITPGYPTQVSVGTNSTELFPANPNRKYVHVFNNSQEVIFLQYQVSAALNQGIKIQPGTFFTLDSTNLWLGAINAIGLISNQLIDCLSGE